MTVLDLIDQLNRAVEKKATIGNYKVMLRCDFGDLIVGGHLKVVKIDGFHEHLNLVGPKTDEGYEFRDENKTVERESMHSPTGAFPYKEEPSGEKEGK